MSVAASGCPRGALRPAAIDEVQVAVAAAGNYRDLDKLRWVRGRALEYLGTE